MQKNMIMREWGGVIITTIQQSQWKMTDVTEEPVQGASTWSSTPSAATAKSSTLLLTEDTCIPE